LPGLRRICLNSAVDRTLWRELLDVVDI